MKTLILGGVKSGKSRLAETLAIDSGLEVVVVATAIAGDEEMRQRIARHRQQRPADWQVIEEPLRLAEQLDRHAASHRCLIVDCLTLWLTQLLCQPDRSLLTEQRDALLAVLAQLPGRLVLVGNETGLGVVPPGALSRDYCDQAGLLHQQLAVVCDQVLLTVAGLPLVLKGEMP